MAYDVFVSYRWVEPDQSWVRESLVPALKRAGLEVCLDVEDFVPGRDLISEMTRAGSESRRALSIISPEYFVGNRMVSFEALMARRFDPGGSKSRLIPFIFRPTDMPEWMHGLVPINWTSPQHYSREWRKLLKVLEAPNLEAPMPDITPRSQTPLVVTPGQGEDVTVRHPLAARLLTEIESSTDIIVVSGNPGSGAVSIATSALSTIQCLKVSVSFADTVREPFWAQSSQEVALLRCVANAIGPSQTLAFARIWGNYERCFSAAGRIRTLVDQSGYGSILQSLQSLVRAGGQNRRDMDPMALLKRVLTSEDDIDLVLRPQRRLLDALSQDLTSIGTDQVLFHFHDMEPAPEAPLVSLIENLTGLQNRSLRLRIVVSVEARPNAFPLLRQLRTFHVPAASTSEVVEYLRESTLGAGGNQPRHDDLIARLSSGSLSVAEFLRYRPRLTAGLAALDTQQTERPIMNAAEGWSLLALAYDVTPDLLSLSFALTEAEALLMADEIPDELDGGRRLPTSIAGAVINASTPTTVRKVNDLLEDHFKVLKSTNDGKWLPPTHAEIGLAFHTAWNSGSLAMIDRCLLANFRTSLSFCSNLHAALSRMLSIAPMSNELAQGVLERLQVIEKIQAGWADDETVLRFFERISDNTADFSRSQRAVAYYQLGHCYFMSGQDDLAAVSLEYAVELDSTYYNAWSLLGVVYDLNKRQRQAIVALREAIKLNGKYEFAHFNLGTIYERRGQLVEAAHSYVAAMKCAPSFYEAAYNLSNTLLELHLIRDAVQVATFTGAIAHEMRVEPIFNIANPHYS